MSALSSVGSDPSLLLQQVQQTRQNPGNAQDFSARMKSNFETAAKAAGVDDSKIPDLENQVQNAVQGVLKGGSANGDQRSAVQSAIDGVLKNNGVDPAKFKSAMQSQGGGRAGGAHRHHGAHHKGGAGKAQPLGGSGDDPTAMASLLQSQVTGTGSVLDVAA